MASLINHLLEIMKDQSLRNISEQVATTKAELWFPGMADKTPFPPSSQAPSVPLSQHQAHTTDIPLAVSKLPLWFCADRRQTVNTTPGTSWAPIFMAALTLEIDGEHMLRAGGGVGGWQTSPPLPKTHAVLQGSVAASVSREKSSPKPACPLLVWCWCSLMSSQMEGSPWHHC